MLHKMNKILTSISLFFLLTTVSVHAQISEFGYGKLKEDKIATFLQDSILSQIRKSNFEPLDPYFLKYLGGVSQDSILNKLIKIRELMRDHQNEIKYVSKSDDHSSKTNYQPVYTRHFNQYPSSVITHKTNISIAIDAEQNVRALHVRSIYAKKSSEHYKFQDKRQNLISIRVGVNSEGYAEKLLFENENTFKSISKITDRLLSQEIKYVEEPVYPHDSIFGLSITYNENIEKYYVFEGFFKKKYIAKSDTTQYKNVNKVKYQQPLTKIIFLRSNDNIVYISSTETFSAFEINNAAKLKNKIINILNTEGGYTIDINYQNIAPDKH